MPTPFEHAWQRFGTSPARTGIVMASSSDFVKANCCVLCDDRHHFRSLHDKYEHLRSKKHLFNYLACLNPRLNSVRRLIASSRRSRLARVNTTSSTARRQEALRPPHDRATPARPRGGRHPFWPRGDAVASAALDTILLDYIICFGRERRDAVVEAWRLHVRKEQSSLIALAAGSSAGHLVVELVMPFVAIGALGGALPFYAY